MHFWDFMRGSASTRLLLDFGLEHGISASTLLKGTTLKLDSLDHPDAEISAAQELRVIENLLKLLPKIDRLGLQVGLRYHFSTYGIWGYGLISSATTRDALTLALRFIPLTYAFTLITYHEEGDLGILSFGEPDLEPHVKQFLVERDMAAAAVLLHELSSTDFGLRRLTFHAKAQQGPQNYDDVQRIFGIAPHYSSTLNSLAFDRAALDQPLPQANAITASMCEQLCRELLERRQIRSGTASIVRQYLTVQGNTWPDLTMMAKLIHTSERTLKRHLKEEGTSFRNLLEEVRRNLAETLLSDAQISMTEIAERLGFSDASSFSQTFKRWYGIAPNAYRKALLVIKNHR
ncbi:AraC family transcriptional regulator [Aquirhabdus parva]|uniref:AraC family transcriptional regulator n=1 Tax=Aquirhabdus parva TaxID=2283318 RepID=A0A345P2F6_9GAMM|nr:AraC family transcriptional regulator [Aquirhabdus parva]AXI01465.1 AraC family transcriptional regulator [Aquirhabdus parva]